MICVAWCENDAECGEHSVECVAVIGQGFGVTNLAAHPHAPVDAVSPTIFLTGAVSLVSVEGQGGSFPPNPTSDTAFNKTFVLRWNGKGWDELPGLVQKATDNVLWSVSATDVWGWRWYLPRPGRAHLPAGQLTQRQARRRSAAQR
jgi:hypothetical protein